MPLSRRQALGAFGAFAATAMLAGCAGFTGQRPGTGRNAITFKTWGSDAEVTAFRKIIADFEAAVPGAHVELDLVPYQQMFQNVDAQLASGTAPDVFRVDYGNLGVYSSQGQLLDLTDYLDAGTADTFVPAFWRAVQFDGKPYGIPHQTDTSALVFDTAALQAAGITSVPDRLEDAWSFDEFRDVLTKLKGTLAAGRYPFVDNWQLAGVTRWFNWLFAAGGRFLDEDLTRPAIESDAGRKALEYTTAFFTEKLVPANSSIKAAGYADTLFESGTSAMASLGNFLLPDVQAYTKADWSATYLPQDVRSACDLGGNAIVGTAQSANPDLAAEFLRFIARDDVMAAYCTATTELPTLVSLVDSGLQYPVRPDAMAVFTKQATTLQPDDVAQLSSPAMASITQVLTDQLELAFTAGRGVDTTLRSISVGIEEALAA